MGILPFGAEPVPSDEVSSSSSTCELGAEGTYMSAWTNTTDLQLTLGEGWAWGAPARAMAADPATKSGWLVLM